MTSIAAKKRTRSGKKPQIIALAAEAFSERGYSAASLRDIGQRAGVTAASLYHHFENKEDLLRAIVMDGADRLTETLKVEVARENDPRTRLEQVIRAHIAFTCENIEVTKIILEEMRFLNEVDFANMREKNYAILDIYRGCLTELAKASEPTAQINVTTTAFLIISVVNGFNRWFRPSGKMGLKEAIDRSVEFVMAGLAIH
jgi:TetR/AcrR family transcriptional regulator, cholesterol catabolism regulator